MISAVGPICLFLWAKCQISMKCKVFSEWISPEAVTNGQVTEKASNSRMSILELSGEHVFLLGGVSEKSCETSLLLMEGEISFSIRGERVAVLAPAYIDFILVSNRWSDIKTNAAFKGRLILSDKIFFKKTIDNIRFNFSEVIYWCAQKPFVSFGDEESKRMILLTDLLIDIINKPDHHFCEEIQKDFLQTLLLDLWNIVFKLYKTGSGSERYVWADMLGRFLHLVRTHCREHHEVKWYAEQLCVSPDVLSTRLRKFYGKNASQLIEEELLLDAKGCLLDPEKSVQDVAELLNFSDQSAFCKFFRRCCGVSPGAYRKMNASRKSDVSLLLCRLRFFCVFFDAELVDGYVDRVVVCAVYDGADSHAIVRLKNILVGIIAVHAVPHAVLAV